MSFSVPPKGFLSKENPNLGICVVINGKRWKCLDFEELVDEAPWYRTF